MIQSLLISAAVKVIQMALCQFYGFCMSQDECPDGVCDDAVKAVDSLADIGEPTADPTKVRALGLSPDWSKLKPLTDATVAFIEALMAFLGVNRKVG